MPTEIKIKLGIKNEILLIPPLFQTLYNITALNHKLITEMILITMNNIRFLVIKHMRFIGYLDLK